MVPNLKGSIVDTRTLLQKLGVWSGEEGIWKMVASNEVHSHTVPQIFRFG